MEYGNRFQALHFEVTNQCNLRCRHCYNIAYLESGVPDLSLDEVKLVIDRAVSMGCRDMGFSGGEPFMREDMTDILEYVKAYPVHILSNGLLINAALLERIGSIEGLLIEFRISLDGLEYNLLFRGADYREVLGKIQLLLNYGHVVTVNTMITDENIDELPVMYEMLKAIGIDRWRLDFVFCLGNAAQHMVAYSNRDKIFSVLKKLVAAYIRERPDFELDINKIFRSSLLHGSRAWRYSLDSRPCSYQGSLTVRPNGDVSFCPSLNLVHGNLLSDTWRNLTEEAKWKEFSAIRVSDLHERCRVCPYMKYCGGGCRADAWYESGSLYGYSAFTCDLMAFYVREILPMTEAAKNSNNRYL